MRSRDFCYWLQGFFELSKDNRGLTEDQVRMIRAHLNLVFKEDDSSAGVYLGPSSRIVNDEEVDDGECPYYGFIGK